MVTIEALKELQDELKAQFGADDRVAIAHVRTTQLSIARHYGGCKVQGKYFVYNPVDDSLIREDVFQWVVKRLREKAKESAATGEQPISNRCTQNELFEN